MKLHLVKSHNIEDHISDNVKTLPPSGIREFFDIVYNTPDCISLGVGEPDFVTPWRISDAGIYAIKDGNTHYTSNKGLLELRQAIASMLSSKYKIEYNPETQILITNGVSEGLDIALRAICNPGDEIIYFEPCYVSYAATIKLAHGTPVAIATHFENEFAIDINAVKKAITAKTKAIMLNYPSNPTGASINKETLEAIAAIAVDNNLLIISDEIYDAITYNGTHFSIIEIPGMAERTIYFNGFSKAYAMTGWRLGYACGPEAIIAAMNKIHQYTALCASSIAQYAAIEAIKHGKRDVAQMTAQYLKRRNFVTSRLNEMGLSCHPPKGAFYAFPDISKTGLSSRDFALQLLKSYKVAVVPGTAFGSAYDNHIRCAYATSMEQLKEAMDRMEEFVKKIKGR
ncbi:MAG: aminotransferase class I/II-fold pyridoxal phosphate-dependent enzyme [Spirochaetes bacterium]|nr:aminotransferase class I/II-fold pyridoxal phosphate-dependent enzyme [Spirochaetota bacterium]